MSMSQFRRDIAEALLREPSGPRQSVRDGSCLTESAEPLSMAIPLAEVGASDHASGAGNFKM
jgi:hypothetical protein